MRCKWVGAASNFNSLREITMNPSDLIGSLVMARCARIRWRWDRVHIESLNPGFGRSNALFIC